MVYYCLIVYWKMHVWEQQLKETYLCLRYLPLILPPSQIPQILSCYIYISFKLTWFISLNTTTISCCCCLVMFLDQVWPIRRTVCQICQIRRIYQNWSIWGSQRRPMFPALWNLVLLLLCPPWMQSMMSWCHLVWWRSYYCQEGLRTPPLWVKELRDQWRRSRHPGTMYVESLSLPSCYIFCSLLLLILFRSVCCGLVTTMIEYGMQEIETNEIQFNWWNLKVSETES